jgi:transcriptional regulator with XRE-family HTH domain
MAHDTEYVALVAVAIRAAAYYRGMSTEDIAESVGMHIETVRRWMRGATALSAEDASKVARALDAPGEMFVRPPATRERALAMMQAWDVLREDGSRP